MPRWSEHVRALVCDPDRDAWSPLVRSILTATVTPAADLAGHLPTEAQEEIMSTADQLIAQGHAWGLAKGQLETAQSFLKKMLRLRFGPNLPLEVLDRINSAGIDAIDRWADRVETAPNAASVFAD